MDKLVCVISHMCEYHSPVSLEAEIVVEILMQVFY